MNNRAILSPFSVITILCVCFCFESLSYSQPEYEIISLGQVGEVNSGGQAISADGQFVTGFSGADAFTWSPDSIVTALPSHASRPFSVTQSANDSGSIAGIGATTFFGSSPIPLIWQDSSVSTLSLPTGQTLGRAYGINNNDFCVGSVNGGSLERAAAFTPSGPGTILTQTLAGGALTTAYAVNDDGRIVGQATDPGNAAVTKGFYLDEGDTAATDIGALISIGHNSAIAFDVSNNGNITGSSSFNSGVNGRAFLWTNKGGMIEIPLPPGTSQGGGRGVNNDGWVVGTAGGVFAIPFLYDGAETHRLHDIIEIGGTGWDLETGTSNGAFGISDNGTIVGRANFNGNLTAFAMIRINDVLLGDVNMDGFVDLLDVAPFVDLLSNGGFQTEADINQDGFVNLLDVQPFVDLLAG